MNTGLFVVGRRVIYVPKHVQAIHGGDVNHPDCEHGVITSKNAQTVFVRFDGDSHSKGCYPEDLQYEVKA